MKSKEIDWWHDNYPTDFAVLTNALGEEWIGESVKGCMGATFQKDFHRLGWAIYHPIDGNFDEVVLLSKLLQTFGQDTGINPIIDQLKNIEGYSDAMFHLMVAYQFHRDGWNIKLEVPNRNNTVDFLATKSGEVALVECSTKMAKAPMPFNDRAFQIATSRFTPLCGCYVNVRFVVKTDEASIEEAQQLISDNTQKLRGLEGAITIETPNVRFEVEKSKEERTFVVLVDKRDDLSLADRLLRKIDDENRQIKSEIPVRVVALQILGHPPATEWNAAVKEIHARLRRKRSAPDAVFFFQKRWSGDHWYLDIIGFVSISIKGEVFFATSQFCEKNERLM